MQFSTNLHIPDSAFLALVCLWSFPRSDAIVRQGTLPSELFECYKQYANVNLRDVVGQPLTWFCESPVIKRLRTIQKDRNSNPTSRRYLGRLIDKAIGRKRFKRQAGPPPRKCVRKEYRMLTDVERNRYHQAIITLKRDTTAFPNKFDALALMHTGRATNAAHGGPNFLGWHRVYLLMYEYALQEVDPRICLPYWDSSLDNELDDPATSYVFSPTFLGGGFENSEVTDGPFANWLTPENVTLLRNIGRLGELFSVSAIEGVLSHERTRDITPPTSQPRESLEFSHGGIHVYIGGHMAELETASFDPIFFLHHCYVDYIWELFRTKQRALNIDPQRDYPDVFGSNLHSPQAIMGFGLNLTSEQGYSDELIETYEYEPSPDCSRRRPNCRSQYLRCNIERGRCIPTDPDVVPPPTTTRPPIITMPPVTTRPPRPKPCQKHPLPVQNSYCIDGACDISKWVYVPVKVVSLRPPGFKRYDSFPVKNGKVTKTSDIYQASAYAETSAFISSIRGAPKGYDRCDDNSGIGQVYVQSKGLSYEGTYQESAIIDQRLSTSLSIAYVAVKDPKDGPVSALFRAVDSCGRICHTACKVRGSDEYVPCGGVLDIEDVPGQPKEYSKNYGEATLSTWGYNKNADCPRFLTDNIALTFYCDYRERLPWVNLQGGRLKPNPAFVPTTPPPVPEPEPNECKIDNKCTISVPCESKKKQCSSYGETHKCQGSCNMYAVCNYGRYWTRECPYDWSYHERWQTCTSRRRCAMTALHDPQIHRDFTPRPPPQRTWGNPSRTSYLQQLGRRAFGNRRFGQFFRSRG